MSNTKHTQEPWDINHFEPIIYANKDDKAICVAQFGSNTGTTNPIWPYYDETRQANAARIVACVNAFEGVDNPTEWMAKIKENGFGVLQEFMQLHQQRDELLKACELADALLPYGSSSSAILREAIAKVKNIIKTNK